MGFIYLLTHILTGSIGQTIDKLSFKYTRISPQLMTTLTFMTMTSVVGLYIFLSAQPLPVITVSTVVIIGLIAVISSTANVFDVLSLKVNDLSLREPLVDFEPILAGLIGYVLFPAERRLAYLIAFILGAFIIYWGLHHYKLRKRQSKGIFFLFVATVLYACLPSLYNQVFTYMTPEWVTFFRVASTCVLVVIFFPQKHLRRALTAGRVWYSVLAGVVYSIGAVASLYAIQVFGVALAMLFFMLGPALRYLAGYFILREKVNRVELLSSLMLAVVVALAAFAA